MTPDERVERAQERAAIMEYDAGMSRTDATAYAEDVYGVKL